jgi:phage-related protein
MEPARPLQIVFFRTESGNEPVREWLQSLSREDRREIGADILAVQYQWPVGLPRVDHLGDGLWEIRSRLQNRQARVIFSIIENEIVILHAFIKKRQKTPSEALALAKTRRKQYLDTL